MARKAVSDAFYARLGSVVGDTRYWVASDATQVPVYNNNATGSTPTDGSPFIVVQFPIASTERWPVSDRIYIETGTARLLIMTRRGSGTSKAHRWGDELADLFRDQNFAGVKCQVPTSPLTHDDNEEGGYHRTSVLVPYTFQFEG
jgi:hypothetical protein